MKIRDIQNKLNTFRLIQLEILRKSRYGVKVGFFNSLNLSLIISAILATVSTAEIAIRTNTIWAALIALGIQTAAVILFFIEPKIDFITTRLILTSYLLFYVIVMVTNSGESPYPLYWVYSYIIFAFISNGGLEGFMWAAAQFAIFTFGIRWRSTHFDESLTSQEFRLYVYTFILVTCFSYILSFATKLTADRASAQTKELEETNARYDVILNSIGDGLIATDSKGIVEFVNKEAINLLRLKREELIGQPLTAVVLSKNEKGELIPHRDRPITKVLMSGEALLLNQTSKHRQSILRGDGSEFLAGMIVSPVKVLGQIRGAIMLFHDMSLEDQIDRTKSEFVSLASHQLRTPLNVVSWYVEKLLSERKGPLNDHQKNYLNEISTNNSRMIRLVSDLLNVSRVELGRIKLKYERVDIAKLIDALTVEIEPVVEGKHITFDKQLDFTNGIYDRSDESIVTVIIQNLLSNAIKYTPENGRITFRVTANLEGVEIPAQFKQQVMDAGPGLLLSVSDTGIGIPLEQQSKIFSKLFRADNVQSLDVSGTGLGLYVTQSFVESLGGTIWFHSIPDNGTTFYVYLPYEAKER